MLNTLHHDNKRRFNAATAQGNRPYSEHLTRHLPKLPAIRPESLHGSQLQFKIRLPQTTLTRTPEAPRFLPSVTTNFTSVKNFVTPAQFTNLRTRTLFTKPSIRNVDQMLDPP